MLSVRAYQDTAFSKTQLNTELLCRKKFASSYTSKNPGKSLKNDSPWVCGFFELFETYWSESRTKLTEKAENKWCALARWTKYLEILEEQGNRWSKPTITTVCPYFIYKLRTMGYAMIALLLSAT